MTTDTGNGAPSSGTETPRRRDQLWLVIVAAALWGTDGLLRVPLVNDLEPSTIVFAEHAIICVVIFPWLPSALRAFIAAPAKVQLSILAIGIGASAVATTLFTAAFALGDPVTPLVLQKLQPVIAIAGAAWLLGERITARFPLFLIPTLVGAWLLSFADPLGVAVTQAQAAMLAVGAATLWAGGTVLGRYAATVMAAQHVTMLRFFFGLLASLVIVLSLGAPLVPAAENLPGLLLLALIPGLLALLLYYRGLAATAATRATLGELAFPLTAAFIGVTLLDGSLDASQWVGFAMLLASVTLLALHERRASKPAVMVAALPLEATR